MLQINTGKLFSNGVGRINALRGVLYSNLKLGWERDVRTPAGTLRSTDGRTDNRAIVYELEERIEKTERERGVLVSHTVSPFLDDFSALASFALNVVVSPDPEVAARLTSGRPGFSSYQSPRDFVRRFFDGQVHLQASEADEFVGFVDQLLGLERKRFLAAMRSIKTFVAGMHRIPDDLGLSYTLMVSAIESLAQEFDGYQSTWLDVDERKRGPVEKALRKSSQRVSQAVKDAILSVEHTSLGRRYRAFVLSFIDKSYFRSGDALVGRALSRCELEEALKQAYVLRSKYLHNLQALPDAVSHPFAHSETVYVNRLPTLTFQGLSRLSRHVIRAFVMGQPTVAVEPYNYLPEQSGVVTVALAPQYWVGHRLAGPSDVRRRLEGFLEQLVAVLGRASGAVLTDLRPVLADIERLLPKAAKAHKPAMVALHGLFNGFVGPTHRSSEHEALLERFSDVTLAPSPEILIARTLFRSTTAWSLEVHRKIHDTFFSLRSKASGLHVPRQLDAAISLELADRYRAAGQLDDAKQLISFAVENYPGKTALLTLEESFDSAVGIDWEALLFADSSDISQTR